ncbi:MAG: ribose-phosphate pyrophosphokinase-like domain-containing protein, partial [Marinobacter sp.]
MRRFESCHPSHLFSSSSESKAELQKDTAVSKLMIFAGNANPELAKAIAQKLHIPMGQATVGRFSDGETTVEINENVRGHDVFIIQPT